MTNASKRQEKLLKRTIEAVESSQTIEEAANKLDINRMTIYNRLHKHDLKIIRDSKLRVITVNKLKGEK